MHLTQKPHLSESTKEQPRQLELEGLRFCRKEKFTEVKPRNARKAFSKL